MIFTLWFIIIGVLLVLLALSGSVLKRLPLTTSIVYVLIGFILGPTVFDLFHLDPLEQSALLERGAEIAVIISLFSAGLKLRLPLLSHLWRLPVLLAFVSMTVTVGLIALTGVVGLGLSAGAAILLGAVLAPTDPVLAADVQVKNIRDYDRLRFSLTGEAGLNDGTAFPFVMLGLGLLGLHEIGSLGWRWLAVDVAWAIMAGLGTGGLLGTLVGYLVIYLRREHKEGIGLDDFLALGLIALSYGVALLIHSYGFLAVFAAGLAVRRVERRLTTAQATAVELRLDPMAEDEDVATHPEKAPAYMASAVLGFTEQLERIGELAVMILVGGILSTRLPSAAWWFIPLLFLVIRPAAVFLGLIGSRTSYLQRSMLAWFGIRGIGSIYYLMFAIEHGLPPSLGRQLIDLTLTVVTVSVFVHGISVTPLMDLYERLLKRYVLHHLPGTRVMRLIRLPRRGRGLILTPRQALARLRGGRNRASPLPEQDKVPPGGGEDRPDT